MQRPHQTAENTYCNFEHLNPRVYVEMDIVYNNLHGSLETYLVSENDKAAQRVYESEGVPAHHIVDFVLVQSTVPTCPDGHQYWYLRKHKSQCKKRKDLNDPR